MRRDKYQPSIREYWVDVSTTGSLKSQVEESLTEQTAIEGEVENLTVGLPSEGMELGASWRSEPRGGRGDGSGVGGC